MELFEKLTPIGIKEKDNKLIKKYLTDGLETTRIHNIENQELQADYEIPHAGELQLILFKL